MGYVPIRLHLFAGSNIFIVSCQRRVNVCILCIFVIIRIYQSHHISHGDSGVMKKLADTHLAICVEGQYCATTTWADRRKILTLPHSFQFTFNSRN